jgi:hypothetical protein
MDAGKRPVVEGSSRSNATRLLEPMLVLRSPSVGCHPNQLGDIAKGTPSTIRRSSGREAFSKSNGMFV